MVRAITTTAVTLELTAEEAAWLRGYLKNYQGGDCDNERHRDQCIRRDLFEALPQLPQDPLVGEPTRG